MAEEEATTAAEKLGAAPASVKSAEVTIKRFQEGIREGVIRGYLCADCGAKVVGIVEFCPSCHGKNLKEVDIRGEGKVLTYTIQFVAPEQFMNEVPYAWVIVELDEGPKMTGWVPFVSSASDLPLGQRVRLRKSYLPGVVFEKI